jgi:hypothetical protein
MDRRTQARSAGGAPSRKTPVRAGGGGMNWVPFAVIGGVAIVVALIGYLIIQANTGSGGGGPLEAANDQSTDLPGTWAPDQGRAHFPFRFSLERTPTPFCEGVPHSESADAVDDDASTGAGTPSADASPEATETPDLTAAAPHGSPSPEGTSDETPEGTPVPDDCYITNPPTSGQHLGVERNVDVTGEGALINLPPDPDVYPPDIVVPRDAIPHVLEHSGVFVGYNCPEGDDACQTVVDELERLVNDRIDNHDNRVVMSRDPDLPVGEIGLAAWQRWDRFAYTDYDEGRVADFIGTHSCRVKWEPGFC